MRKIILICFILIINTVAQSVSTKIPNVHSYMNVDSVTNYIQSLQDFGSRFEYNSNRRAIALWLQNEFFRMGYQQVEIDSFLCATGFSHYADSGEVMQYNVVATLPGTLREDDIYIIGGHYDSFNQSVADPITYAPGADDNASGTTAALETARAIMEAGYQPEATIQFVCFAAEELMLFGYSGSEYMAESRREQNVDIKLMVNNDMISHNPRPIEESRVHINYFSEYAKLKDLAKRLTEQYTIVNAYDGSLNFGADDQSFYDQGYPVVYFEEYDFSPYYHSSEDVIENYDMTYCTEVIKASSAMLIYSVEVPEPVKNFSVVNVGDASSINLTWNVHEVPDVFGYNIYLGTSEDSLDFVNLVSDTTFIIDQLNEGEEYYCGVSPVDSDGNEGEIEIRSIIPNSIPASPVAVNAEPKWQSIQLKWNKNTELDMLGYKIYKTPIGSVDYFPPITYFTTDTVYVDTEVESGIWYEYQVVAVDADSNESTDNALVNSRAVTMDKGILFVNLSSDGDGSIGNPTIKQLEDFYMSLPANNYEKYSENLFDKENYNLADIGPFNTIVMHVESFKDSRKYYDTKMIKEYLNFGGNLLFTGFSPANVFANPTALINSFSDGDIPYDYFGIELTENSSLRFSNGAKSESEGYPDLEIDISKCTSEDGHINAIEVMDVINESNVIYVYQTGFDTSDIKGDYSGRPVGVEYLSEEYNAVVLSIPLYYIKKEQAEEFLNYVLKNKFDTPTSIKGNSKDEEVAKELYLAQNYPNPFNPTTKIRFMIPNSGTSKFAKTKLIIFDVLGREIKTLLEKNLEAGTYEVDFDASNLSSGVYFYRLHFGNTFQTRKMILLR